MDTGPHDKWAHHHHDDAFHYVVRAGLVDHDTGDFIDKSALAHDRTHDGCGGACPGGRGSPW